jgi:hypothetical protein
MKAKERGLDPQWNGFEMCIARVHPFLSRHSIPFGLYIHRMETFLLLYPCVE